MERAKLIEQRDRLAEAISSFVPEPGKSFTLLTEELRHLDYLVKVHQAICLQLVNEIDMPMMRGQEGRLRQALAEIKAYHRRDQSADKTILNVSAFIVDCLEKGGAS